jgi:hypothetical protein
MQPIEEQLKGGHPNSLGNTEEVVKQVLANPEEKLEELFSCYFSEDEIVRMRVSNSMKRIAKANKPLLTPYLPRLLEEVAQIDQASTQWTLAQLFDVYQKDLSPEQKKKAQSIMQKNLAEHHDWIVLNMNLETLARWAKKDENLKDWLMPHLNRLSNEPRKSIANKASKWLGKLE